MKPFQSASHQVTVEWFHMTTLSTERQAQLPATAIYNTLDYSAAYINATANSFLLGALWKHASGTV